MNNQNNNSFFDPRTILAIALVLIVWTGWNTYLGKKYPQPSSEVATAEAIQKPLDVNHSNVPTNPPAADTTKTKKIETTEEKLWPYENQNISFKVSSRGMGLKQVILKNQTDRNHNLLVMGDSEKHALFQVSDLHSPEPLLFTVTQKNENVFEGVAILGSTKIIRTLEINPETEAIKNTVLIQSIDGDFHGLSIFIPEKAIESKGGGFLIPSFEHQEFVVLHSSTEERVNSSAASEPIKKDFANVSMVSIGNQYFTSALVDKSPITPEVQLMASKDQPEVLARIDYKINTKENMELSWLAYSGPKSLSNLEKIDKDLSKAIDLGFFAQIGRVLLILLKWFYSVCGNWGVSIILLTLLVRTIVLPLNVTTFRSTKKMQKLQPLIASLRERYKDDPQALNKETMGLWKEHKVNPLGGCLPMLLQLPIFFALYRVLGQSIELYQAPFFGWIHDLSIKDPWYVLPILMGICMYVQQKITPTTMDPTQAKVMQFLPIVFAFMMVSLPAGLTLYIFINTLSGILLQQIFMRDRSTAITSKAAKA